MRAVQKKNNINLELKLYRNITMFLIMTGIKIPRHPLHYTHTWIDGTQNTHTSSVSPNWKGFQRSETTVFEVCWQT